MLLVLLVLLVVLVALAARAVLARVGFVISSAGLITTLVSILETTHEAA